MGHVRFTTSFFCLAFFLITIISPSTSFTRESFPHAFVFGAGSSAYQYEGAVKANGRKPSIWDTFVQEYPEKIADHSTGDRADEFYYLYKEDIDAMKQIGLDSFRISISWSRIVPEGKVSRGVNEEGLRFYNNLIDQLLKNGIQPLVTLLHWDPPQALEDEYGGFLSPQIVHDYLEYVDVCFKEFGDRVKHWITVNEPSYFSDDGYCRGVHAPGRCSNCAAGNSATEPYLVTHHLILCHAVAVKLYRDNYWASQNGSIGISLPMLWLVPKYNTSSSINAANRALDFSFGWVMHPIIYGDYPKIMRLLVGERLPNFTQEQVQLITGSIDFLGINYYTANYVDDANFYPTVNPSYTTDSRVNLTCFGDKKNSFLNALRDELRIKYHHLHLSYLLRAIKEGVDVKGYYIWSLLDNFEWSDGYTSKFGISYVDYANNWKRYFKQSAFWFQLFLRNISISSNSATS